MTNSPRPARSLRIVIVRSDLGIGGSERLVVDAALALREKGHEVTILTAHYDPSRRLRETLDGNLKIASRRAPIPVSIAGRLRVPCTLGRMGFLIAAINREKMAPDVVFCDLVPHVIPLIRCLTKAKILYYCHFPDVLLTPVRSPLYNIYRFPFDRLEQVGIGMAHTVLVNSLFTRETLLRTFPPLRARRIEVLYPGVDVKAYASRKGPSPDSSVNSGSRSMTILSINRFDPRKNLVLALESLARLRALLPPKDFEQVRLTIAGGCDARLPGQRQTRQDLEDLALRLNVRGSVDFLVNATDERLKQLLKDCCCLVYTSIGEHFGIGIVEAMAAGKPVIAVNHGGPREILQDGITGRLCDPTPLAFAEAIANLIRGPQRAAELGIAAQKRAAEWFSRESFSHRLDELIRETVSVPGHV
jgi:glycosyltransferase involved in cell wall biosynthesis